MISALRCDVVAQGGGSALEPGNVRLRCNLRPRPLTLRVNVGDDPEDAGEKAYNYRTEPFWARLGGDFMTPEEMNDEDLSDVLKGNIETPLFTMPAGQRVMFRLAKVTSRARRDLHDPRPSLARHVLLQPVVRDVTADREHRRVQLEPAAARRCGRPQCHPRRLPVPRGLVAAVLPGALEHPPRAVTHARGPRARCRTRGAPRPPRLCNLLVPRGSRRIVSGFRRLVSNPGAGDASGSCAGRSEHVGEAGQRSESARPRGPLRNGLSALPSPSILSPCAYGPPNQASRGPWHSTNDTHPCLAPLQFPLVPRPHSLQRPCYSSPVPRTRPRASAILVVLRAPCCRRTPRRPSLRLAPPRSLPRSWHSTRCWCGTSSAAAIPTG